LHQNQSIIKDAQEGDKNIPVIKSILYGNKDNEINLKQLNEADLSWIEIIGDMDYETLKKKALEFSSTHKTLQRTIHKKQKQAAIMQRQRLSLGAFPGPGERESFEEHRRRDKGSSSLLSTGSVDSASAGTVNVAVPAPYILL
jgi:hypothetical protein